eukprot:scaffold27374_cov112-Isochrysis_galbana.AAC.2
MQTAWASIDTTSVSRTPQRRCSCGTNGVTSSMEIMGSAKMTPMSVDDRPRSAACAGKKGANSEPPTSAEAQERQQMAA